MKYVMCVLVVCFVMAYSAGASPISGKKLIEYGWDRPGTAFVREHIREMEKTPFDGIVLCVNHKDDTSKKTGSQYYGLRVFSSKAFTDADVEHAIVDLKATQFHRFTDNFVQVIAYPGDVDWFDQQWSSVAQNAACLARVAKLGGCAGVMFDPEIYSPDVKTWNYSKFPAEWKSAHSFSEYQAMVRQRGREFIRAINREFPNIKILCLFGYSLPYVQTVGQKKELKDVEYALLPAFYDGVCEAATPETVFIDGHEWSYRYKTRKEFAEGRQRIWDSVAVSQNPKAARKHLQVGMGLWPDSYNREFLEDWSKNLVLTPEQFRTSLYYAMEQADEYVWVYTQKINWWYGIVPQPYVDALALCKEGPGEGAK